MSIATLKSITGHTVRLVGSRYGEHQLAAQALELLDDAASALQQVTDSSIAALARTVGIGSSKDLTQTTLVVSRSDG